MMMQLLHFCTPILDPPGFILHTSSFALRPLHSNLLNVDSLLEKVDQELARYEHPLFRFSTRSAGSGVLLSIDLREGFGVEHHYEITRQAAEMWEILGKPARFTWVEMGAGRGWFARDFLAWVAAARPDFMAALDYLAVEPGPRQRDRLLERLAGEAVATVDDGPRAV